MPGVLQGDSVVDDARLLPGPIITRPYQSGDGARIVELLNVCYGHWGTLERWHALYPGYPGFRNDDVFVIEQAGKIVGHRGLHFRDVQLGRLGMVPTVSLGDTAVHPACRGLGLYAGLHQATLKAAHSRGALLAFTWNLKGSTTHSHNKTTGFIEIRQAGAYMKVMNPAKVLRSGLSDFTHKNQKLRRVLHDLRDDLWFSIGGDAEFSSAELIGEPVERPEPGGRGVTLFLAESSLPVLASFRTMGSLQRMRGLAILVLCRRVRIRVGSPAGFLRVARKGVSILGAL